MSESRPTARDGRHGYPLAILFLLVTMATTGGALLGAVVRSAPDVSWREFVYLTVGTVIGSTLFGGIIGLFHFRRRVGILVGVLSGVLVGIVIGPLLAINQHGLQLALAAETAGGMLLVVTAATLRIFNSRSDDLL